MKLFGLLLVLAGAGTVALAQTNTPADTNYSGSTSNVVMSATNDMTNVRQLSLQECIEMALQHNLDLRIDRYTPQISLYNLRANYGDYDPSLFMSGQHTHNESGPQLVAGGFQVPGSTTDADSFQSTLSGLLPWGTTYTLGTGNITDSSGTSGTLVPNPNSPISFTTNTVFLLTNNLVVPTAKSTTNFNQMVAQKPFENTSGSVSIQVNQPLLKNFWIDQTRLNIRVGKNRLKYSEQGLRLQIMQTITQLEQAYYELIFDRENVIVQAKAVELAERLVQENKKKVEVGAMAPLDEQQAESQAATTRAALIAAKATLAVQEHLIKQLIVDNYAEWADYGVSPVGNLTAPLVFFNRPDSWGKALTKRPELLQARLDLEKAGIQLKYDKNQLLPELDVFATYGYNGTGREFSDALGNIAGTDLPFYTYGGKITVPLANVKARNNYRASRATMEQAVLSVKKTERDIMVAVDNDIRLAQSSYEQVGATRAATEYAAAALDAEQKKLDSGKSTTYTVLQMQRDLTTARGNEIQALDAYNKNLSQLSLDEGTTLERLNVNLEVK
jgi:outer membrane protein TolC